MKRMFTKFFISFFAIFATAGCFVETPKNILTKGEKQDCTELVNANNATGIDIYSKLSLKKGNVVMSPYSIGTAMTMALAGAEGVTATEMAKVMHRKLKYNNMNVAAGNLYKTLNGLNSSDITLETANGLCLVTPSIVSESYTNLLQKYYFAEIFYGKDVKPVNDWVNKKTHKKIPEILNSLPANTVSVILNAIYFKGLWEKQFKKSSTFDSDFLLDNGGKIKIPMMHQSDKFAMITKKDFSAIEMPFKGKLLSFIAIMPSKGAKLADFEKKFNLKQAISIIAALKKIKHPSKLDIAIPIFKIEYEAELVPPFKQLGMTNAFSAKLADFGKLTGQKNKLGLVWIAQIKHKAFIEINEEGGEAAAATALIMEKKCVAIRQQFIANRPFLFMIKDNVTDSILFLGRVVNPKIEK